MKIKCNARKLRARCEKWENEERTNKYSLFLLLCEKVEAEERRGIFVS